jgi:DNA mismatch repair ATPase MutS
MLEQATPDSVLIMNETLNSTTLADAQFLGEKLLGRITELGARCIYVTFVDELASFDESVVSMVGGIDADADSVRTYEITRRPADGRAYAMALAERYGLTYEQLKGRIEC